MEKCGYAVCPSDSHKKVIKKSNYVLKTSGGYGIVRELVEDYLKCDSYKILYEQ